MPVIAANGVSIAYEQRGQGPPLLLIMGLGGQLTDWPEGLVDLLAERFTVISFDNRDAGLSSETDGPVLTTAGYLRALVTRHRPPAGYQLADMAADAVGLLDALGIERADVVGVSMGGMIAQVMAIDHAARVAGLTSIMSSTGNRRKGRSKPSLMAKLARRPRIDADSTVDEVVDEAVKVFELVAGPTWDRDEVRRAARASVERSFRPEGTGRQLAAIAASPDRTADLARVRAPTLVVHGLADPLVRPSGGIATAEAIPGSRLLMFPDMGHDLPRTRWSELTAAIGINAGRVSETLR